MQKKIIIIVTVGLFLLAINFVFVFNYPDKPTPPVAVSKSKDSFFSNTQAYVLPLVETSYIPIYNSNSPRPQIDAKSALVYDYRSARLLYSKDPNIKLPIASLTKVMTAVITLENLNLGDVATIDKSAVKVDGTKQDLYLGEQITVENLLKLMLIESSNDAANALSDFGVTKGVDFLAKMNEKIASLGMMNSRFLDPAGLDDDAYSTAEDLARLVKYSLKDGLIWNLLLEKDIVIKSVDGKFNHEIKNTNTLLSTMPDIIGGKTGYTDNALGCMILIVDVPGKNDRLISIVLGSKDRFGDTQKLIEWTRSSYRWD